MSENVRPAFWQRQPALPMEVRRFIRARLEDSLQDPLRRTVLVWPTILGAPRQLESHPYGIPLDEFLPQAKGMIGAVGVKDEKAAWEEDLSRFPDTAEGRDACWLPHPLWKSFAGYVSLRCGVILLALTGQPEDERYLLASAVSLFNLSLFHECHEALELLWRRAEGDLKKGLQGLILLTCGFHHQQCHRSSGMQSIWKDGIPQLSLEDGALDTPWGRVGYAESLAMALRRLEWLKTTGVDEDPARFWEMPPPHWELR
jgi:hypothetical protein